MNPSDHGALREALKYIIADWDDAILYDDDDLIWSAGMWTYDGGKSAYPKEEMERRITEILQLIRSSKPGKKYSSPVKLDTPLNLTSQGAIFNDGWNSYHDTMDKLLGGSDG